jgi:hypothetical protein
MKSFKFFVFKSCQQIYQHAKDFGSVAIKNMGKVLQPQSILTGFDPIFFVVVFSIHCLALAFLIFQLMLFQPHIDVMFQA